MPDLPDPNPFPAEPTVKLRDAVEQDLPAIVEVFNASIPGRAANAELKEVTVESRRDWFHAHSPNRRPLWVATLEGLVIGWVGLSDLFPRDAYQITAEVSVYVAPEHQGRGLGGWMLQALIQRCPEIGVENVISLVFAHNEPSLKAHEKLGFERWGFLPEVTRFDQTRRDVVILGRKTGG